MSDNDFPFIVGDKVVPNDAFKHILVNESSEELFNECEYCIITELVGHVVVDIYNA